DPEAAFLSAVVEVLIPADQTGPGGVEAGVIAYMDRQLAGAWGNGARMYLDGPWSTGTPQQGYQLPLTPARLFRIAIPEVEKVVGASDHKNFAELTPARRNEVLVGLDSGDVKLDTVPGPTFMAILLSAAVEGYFSDPAYGGNRNMAAWRMIGFPGARGAYADDIVASRGKPFRADPVSLADLQ
ncbi:MAG TPA: gluconate 2-dehydrogenase subunit 3 family protein, partial [Magnetospirillum sp.]|nr:gluconate 2-dehydrogenase subunit 3 family protein [Magnetospirillum sp.]